MKQFTIIFLLILILAGFFVFRYGRGEAIMTILPDQEESSSTVSVLPLASTSSSSTAVLPSRLDNPPDIIRAKYFTGWVAGSNSKMDAFIASAEREHINAIVIDIKDYSGYVSYAMDVPGVITAGADKQLRMGNINGLIEKLHAKGIYVIGRVTVFQDPVFAKAHPELSLKNTKTGLPWRDSSGLAWLDASGKPTWDYVISIAKDAYARGFDEVNFDYVRFPSDGDLASASYPFWDKVTPRHEVLREFFSYLRANLPDRKISVDLFGLVTVETTDMGIGQVIEDAYPYVDYISPMIYPSHYASGFIGFKNPAIHPYEVITYSLQHAVERRNILLTKTSSTVAQLRPWLQVFDLGAKYTPEMVGAEIKATTDVLTSSTAGNVYAGWLLWDPSTAYRSYDALY